jgi:RHS repeat-associated protein
LSYTNEDGITTYTKYDNITDYTNNVVTRGNVTSETDENGITTSFTYDLLDRQTSISVPNGTETVTNSYTYTGAGRQSTLTRNGFSYTFNYDAFGNDLNVKAGNRTLITNQYAANDGELTRSTYGNGNYVENSYTESSKTATTKWNGTATATYKYNSAGELLQKIDNARNATYNYDIRYNGALEIVTGTDNTEFTHDSRVANTTTNKYQIGPLSKTISYQSTNNGNTKIVNLPNATKTDTLATNGRLASSVVAPTSGASLTTGYTYYDDGNIETMTDPANGTWSYTYDPKGNISTVSLDGVLKLSYEYDSLGQLTRENNVFSDATYKYEYDIGGNIEFRETYAYTTGEVGAVLSTDSYVYDDPNWKDLLKSYNGSSITYDGGGNPLTYNGYTFTWQRGRELATANNGTNSISYQYNDEGIRTQKTVNGVVHKYFLDGAKVIQEQIGTSDVIWYYYDSSDNLIGFELNGTPYYYAKNAHGDVTGILNSSGTVVAAYTYDAWGNILNITGSNLTVANINSYRYRGYRFDSDTGLYYLHSRYYDPQVGRFINEDVYIDTGTGALGTNMFAYCENNPSNKADPNGQCATALYLAPSILDMLAPALSSLLASITTSMSSIATALVTAWTVVVAIAAIGVAIGGIIYAVKKIQALYAKAQQVVTAVRSKVKAGGISASLRNNTVYVISAKSDNKVWYVGRTKNFSARKKAHQESPYKKTGKPRFPKSTYSMYPIVTNLTLNESRVYEQCLIMACGTLDLSNMINSISPQKFSQFKSEYRRMQSLIASAVEEG